MFELLFFSIVIGIGVWVGSRFFIRVTVFEYQHGLLFENGVFVNLVGPGSQWIFQPKSRIEILDARLKILTVPGQEILSKDGVTLKISVLVEYLIKDPKIALLKHADYVESLYALVQKELRSVVGEAPIESVLETKTELSTQIGAAVKIQGESLGLGIAGLSIKDVMFPGPLKESFSQVARARQEAQATLEKARGESAAIRSLANTAKVLESNPELYRLRFLQTLDRAESLVVHIDSEKSGRDGTNDGTS